MKVIVTGSTGMVGEGVLFECLENSSVSNVLMLNRKHYEKTHPKLQELIVPDFSKLENYSEQLKGFDACFYCAGVSAVGMKEETYTRITYDLTLSVATVLLKLNPQLVFIYVTGTRTDSTEKGKFMWARVKGRTENALMRLYGANQYNFRPAIMKATRGQVNVKTIYRLLGPLISPFYPLKTLTLQQVGRAMINAVLKGYPKQILEVNDIDQLSKQ
jgi:nucleoside-diphosphate-sugar epimerase